MNSRTLPPARSAGPDWSALLTPSASYSEKSIIRELFKRLRSRDIISFAGGMPDPALFPYKAVRHALDDTLSQSSHASLALNYGATEGYSPLRSWIAQHMHDLGCTMDASNVLITSGGQQALDLACRVMLSPGDAIVVAAPTYLGALQIFRSYGAKILSIPTDRQGPIVERFEQALGKRPKLVYLVSDFANPSGQTIDPSRRAALVRMARDHGVPIVDDAAYQQLRYDGDSPLPMIAVDQSSYKPAPEDTLKSGGVLHVGTFSKTMAPGLRVGWIAAAKGILDPIIAMKQATDLHSPPLNQMVLAKVIGDCYETHVARLVRHYRAKRDAMTAALRDNLPSNVIFVEPEGGMFIWLELPEHLDSIDLLGRAMDEAHVAFIPGAPFFASSDEGRRFCRLSFSGPSLEDIDRGINQFCRLLRSLV